MLTIRASLKINELDATFDRKVLSACHAFGRYLMQKFSNVLHPPSRPQHHLTFIKDLRFVARCESGSNEK